MSDNFSPIASHPIFGTSIITNEDSQRFFFTSHQGTRMVLLQGCILKWCNVIDTTYHSMKVKSIFNNKRKIIDVKLSESGDFLCIYTTKTIDILEIPWGYEKIPDELLSKFQPFHYDISSSTSALSSPSDIKQVLFHPKSYHETCLVILYEDSIIQLIDTTASTETITINQPTGTLGVETRVIDIESICFDKTTGLILYALSISDGGDIYALYPCLPTRLDVSKKEVDLLLQKSIVLYDSLKENMSNDVKRNVIKQLQFATKLQGQFLEQLKGEKDEERTRHAQKDLKLILDVDLEYRLVNFQGPFTISPFPNELYSATAKESQCMKINENNELLIMTFDDGSVALLFRDLELTMSWDIANYIHDNSFALVELIKLKPTDIGRLIIYQDNFGKFFLLSDDVIMLVHTNSWSDKLAKAIDDSNLNILSEIGFESEITWFDVMGKFNNCTPCKYHGKESIIFVSSDNVFVENLTKKHSMNNIKGSSTSNSNEETAESEYKVTFKQPIDELMTLNELFQKQCRMPFSKLIKPEDRQIELSNESNEIQLEILTDLSKELITKIIDGQTLGFNLHNRLKEQQLELTRQLKHTQIVFEKQDCIKNKNKEILKRWNEQLNRSVKLTDRLQNLNEKLITINDSPNLSSYPITSVELEWFKEIRNQVHKFNSFVHTQRDANEELSFLKKELDRISNDVTSVVDEKSKKEWEELRAILEQDSKIIKECNIELTKTTESMAGIGSK
ncbi:linker nucleoporin NUP82 NDAI_0G05750 [Naumovozyma dairenensis CBS 421]|uniref:Nucleoporin Nup82 n=1 Tax=Naumovozyma dairenensis (strain ATCC 10597 / BCRC 20456 / CBS 421 / NBRC 0211 / NRRL Y-12639) TaxID=1071378 RepID=J7SB53_NAUDC|nr:hypothetical protein NDAI_0G05750 [Naumovozyma dairenensis CBS 421]CCK73558.1 hypothetical protein NDAI_0G05750 [Naumovozyma dairenensis CBS 421]